MRWIWVPGTRRGRVLGGLVALALVLILLAPLAAWQIPALRRQAHQWAESRLTRSLGREVRVGGLGLLPWLGRLDLRQVKVAAGPTLRDGTLLAADSIRLRWSWGALLRRTIEIDQIILSRPRLVLPPTVASLGAPGDLFPTLLRLSSVRLEGFSLAVRELEVEEGLVIWGADAAGGRVEGLSGSARWSEDSAGRPAIVVGVRASRIPASLGGEARELRRVSLQGVLSAQVFTVTAAEAEARGARLGASGRLVGLGDAAQADLRLTLAAPLGALLSAENLRQEVEGNLEIEGRLTGPLARPTFQGTGALRPAKTARLREPVAFGVRWERGRLEAETVEAGGPDSLSARLSLEPATGSYQVRLAVREADLAGLTGLPALAAQLAGLTLPSGLRGRLSANLDFSGRGTDLATLRGRGTVRVEELAVEGELSGGRFEARVVATSTRLSLEAFSLDVPGGTVQGRGGVNFSDGRLDLPIRANLGDVGPFARGFGLPLVGGRLTFQGQLAGTREAPRLRGRLAWRDPRIALQEFDQIEGEVELASRAFRTSRLLLRLGSTTALLRGSVTARGTAPLQTLDPKQDLMLDLQGQVGPGRIADLARFLPDALAVRGAFRASGRIAGAPGAASGEVDVTLTNPETWGEQWQRGDARLRLSPQGMEITRLTLQRGPEQVTGEIRIGKDSSLSGRLAGVALDLGKLDLLAGSRVTGRAGAQVELQGSLTEPRVLGRATSDGLAFRDVPFGAATGTFSVTRQGTALEVSAREGSYRLRMKLGPPPDRTLELDLALADADLDPLLRLAEVEALRPWQPRGSGRILLRGPAGDFAAADGEASLTALRLLRKEQVWESRGPVELAWRGKTVDLRQARLRSGEREVEVHGTLGEGDRTDLQVKGQFPLSALQGYLSFVQPLGGAGQTDLRVRGPLGAPDLQGKLEISEGRLALQGIAAPLEEVRSTLDLQGGRISLRSLQGRLGDGRLRAAGEAFRAGGQWDVRIAFQQDDGRAEQILAGFYKHEDSLTGTLSLGGTLKSRGGSEQEFRAGLEGGLRLAVRDGRVGRQSMIAGFLSAINIGQLFDAPGPGAASQGLPFQRLTADITIDHGVARTENLLFESRAFNLSAVGEVNLVEETIAMDVALKPFQNLDWFLAKIPLAGWLLGGKEKSLVAAFYRVTGPLQDPKVTSLTAKSVGRNVFGVFRRLLDIPDAIVGP